jgi:hypothetical protein
MLVVAVDEELTWENACYPVRTRLPTKALVGVVSVTRTMKHGSPWVKADPTDDEMDDNGDSTILIVRERHQVRPQPLRRLPRQCGLMKESAFDLTPMSPGTVPRLILPEVEPVAGQLFGLLSIATLRRLAHDLGIKPLPASDDGLRRRVARFIGRTCEDAIGLLDRDEAQGLWTRISGDKTPLDIGKLYDLLITACGEQEHDEDDDDDDDIVIESDDDE